MFAPYCVSLILATLCVLLIWQQRGLRDRIRELEGTHRKFAKDQEESAATERNVKKRQEPGYETQFLANISHELRTPLNSMLILSKLLRKNQEGQLTALQLKWVNTICNSGTDLLKLIDDILDFSKIEAQTPRLRLECVSLRGIGDHLRELFQCVADEKNLEFSIEMDEGIPESLHTDPDRLKQILRNFVSNAFKFTESGQVQVKFCRPGDDTAWATGDSGCSGLAISVSDSGIGIAEENHEAVFQAFRQEDSGSTRKYGGTGLGLAISRKLAVLLGGSIELEGEKGVGSTFTLYLPARTREPVESS